MSDDPFSVLGLPRTATVAEVQAARRALAKRLHPDVGGDQRAMASVNHAVEQALEQLSAPTPRTGPHPGRSARPDRQWPRTQRPRDGRAAHDHPCFTVEALPVETFEALRLVASWFGEVVDDDPPYVLDVALHDPFECWCRLELVPDAGASTVSLTVVAEAATGWAPDVDVVRDRWIDGLNELDWGQLDEQP